MNRTTKCQGVCEDGFHADNGEAAPTCDLSDGHDKAYSTGVEVYALDGEWMFDDNVVPATPHRCEDCLDRDASDAEAAYEAAYYGM